MSRLPFQSRSTLPLAFALAILAASMATRDSDAQQAEPQVIRLPAIGESPTEFATGAEPTSDHTIDALSKRIADVESQLQRQNDTANEMLTTGIAAENCWPDLSTGKWKV